MKTNTTKLVRSQNLQKAGKFKTSVLITVLYRRYATELWATAFWVVIAIDVWIKLG